jgi:ribosomal-protein-serine acetyltransferase
MSLTPAMLSHLETPILTDGIVTLRAYQSSDAPVLFAAVRESVDHVGEWLAWCTKAYALTDSAGWIERARDQWRTGADAVFGVFDSTNGQLLGAVGIDDVHQFQRTANLGYWTRRTALGRGVAPRAVRLAARYALTAKALERLEIVVACGNRPSQRVAEKCGAVLEGILRFRLHHHGRSHDARLYSLVRTDLSRWA